MRPHPRRVISAAVVVFFLVSALVIVKSRAHSTATRNYIAKPGPWGQLKCVHIAIEMPELFVSLNEVRTNHAHWFFRDQKRKDVLSLCKAANLTAAQLQALEHESKWDDTTNGIWVSPPDELVLGLEKTARRTIYSSLAKFRENGDQSTPFAYRSDRLDEMLQHSGLHDSTVEQFRGLLYDKGHLKLFSDADVFANHLSDDEERSRFFKTISRASTLLVKLQIDENSPIDSLVDYWSYGGRRKDVRALLQSMAAVPGGCSVDIAHLLPTFVRQHIYTYPHPDTLNVTNHHCHWTSLNFLNDTPDERFGDEQIAKATVSTEFVPVEDAPQLGDIYFFIAADGSVLHSATYIADDIVFTKNGGAPNRPWIYMQLEDLLACYLTPEEPIQLVRVRRKHV